MVGQIAIAVRLAKPLNQRGLRRGTTGYNIAFDRIGVSAARRNADDAQATFGAALVHLRISCGAHEMLGDGTRRRMLQCLARIGQLFGLVEVERPTEQRFTNMKSGILAGLGDPRRLGKVRHQRAVESL